MNSNGPNGPLLFFTFDDAKKVVDLVDSFYDICAPEILAGHARAKQELTNS
jgi:hypothetical protein